MKKLSLVLLLSFCLLSSLQADDNFNQVLFILIGREGIIWNIIGVIVALFIILGFIYSFFEDIPRYIKKNRIYKNSSYEGIIKKPKKYNIEIIENNNEILVKAFFIAGYGDNLKSLILVLNHFKNEGWKNNGEIKESAALKMHYIRLSKDS